ncbi:replication protein RepA [Pyxidicoccus sp. MSG2]|uniref:replication protein RepA n=1 Tax=Pyxidicoccus sp. MSG2 TaxID=2996790 RepID=UPI002271F450|nr:replication protein RepA [Pyxidicoccus sp. MSG2]MCY1023941.1 replication protein RepA [Pyxidicoccus sp. MSG2]
MSDTKSTATLDLYPGVFGTREAHAPGADSLDPARVGAAVKPRESSASRARRLSVKNASKLGAAAAEVHHQSALDAGELGYFSQLLVQTALPHKDPGDLAAWTRQNGRFTLTFSTGLQYDEATKTHKRMGLPFGTHARLLFAWLGTEAVRTRSRRIELGDSFGAFMRKLQLPRTGGPSGSEAAIRNQLRRILTSSISWQYRSSGQDGTTWREAKYLDTGQNIFPIESRILFWDPSDPDKRAFWQSEVSLNETFFQHLLKHNTPVDMRVMRELARAHSSLAMDIYVWWTGRMHGLEKPTPPIPWKKLMEQMGTVHTNPYEFARDFKLQAAKALVFYPEAKIQYVRGGIRLFPSPTHVPARLLPSSD